MTSESLKQCQDMLNKFTQREKMVGHPYISWPIILLDLPSQNIYYSSHASLAHMVRARDSKSLRWWVRIPHDAPFL